MKDKDADFFKRCADSLVRSRFDSTSYQWKENTAGLKASCKVARKIAITKKPHIIGEHMILPCCQVIVSNVFRESEVQKQVFLSNDTVSRKTSELSENILLLVVSKIKKSMFGFFAIQLMKLWILQIYLNYVFMYATYTKGIWRMNFCFAVYALQKQQL